MDDLARWDAAIAGGKLLNAASWQRAFTPYTLASSKSTGYGYGWGMGKLQGAATIAHDGGINGFSTYAVRIPEQKVFVAVLSNADDGLVSPELVARKAAALAIGKPIREFKEIALDGATLERFTGLYEIDKQAARTFRRDGNTLVMQRTGRPPMRPKAFSATGFFMPNVPDYFEFGQDAKGVVTHVTQYVDGKEIRQPRIGDAPPERQVAKIANASFDTRVGRHELAPGVVLALSREGDRYFAQATGQRKLEIFQQSETIFFSREVDAEVRFDGADSHFLVLHQNGKEIRAAKP